MNRFRTKKNKKEVSEATVRPSMDSDTPSLSTLKSSKTFMGRKKYVPEPEPKVELDLTNALPSSDDFRTSLLMSGLSARFSMLREQDDPTSKIGKASDDSVLFPKRQSRLDNFNFVSRGLTDIAEVGSIKDSIRPPFAFERKGSYASADGYGTDDDSSNTGSMMGRSKPGEGNSLFGGRQKIYKIAPHSMKNLSDGENAGMGGRVLYNDDVTQSSFQKMKQREREQREKEKRERDQQDHDEAEQASRIARSQSPPPSEYNRNRETSSTTSSGPSFGRSSTAATSITSYRSPSVTSANTPTTPTLSGPGPNQSFERSMNKGRRLYDTGLDQHLQSQQHSAINRIDSLTKQRIVGAQSPTLPLNASSSASNMSDRYERANPPSQQSQANMRAASPPPTATSLGSFDFGVRPLAATDTSTPAYHESPPMSPPLSDGDEKSNLQIQPNDRGKATALGAFSKPAQPYDDKRYNQRQLQMQFSRETPPLRKQSPPSAFLPALPTSARDRPGPNEKWASARSRSPSAQRNLAPQEPISVVTSPRRSSTEPGQDLTPSGTFLASPDDSSIGSPSDTEGEPHVSQRETPRINDVPSRPRAHSNCPPESQHPALRQNDQTSWPGFGDDRSPIFEQMIVVPHDEPLEAPRNLQTPSSQDSPTLGTPAGLGLSGMIRSHLRSDSNASSVYGGAPSPGHPSRLPKAYGDSPARLARSDPREQEEWVHESVSENDLSGRRPQSRKMEIPPLAQRSPNIMDPHFADGDSEKPAWERELISHHTRNGSSETQRERTDFANDLAARRKRVQDNLKGLVESNSRPASPNSHMDWTKDMKTNPLHILKPKSSFGSLAGKSKDGSTKAMKMLGLGNATINPVPSSAKPTVDDELWRKEEEDMLRDIIKGPKVPPQTKSFRQARRDAQRNREHETEMRHQVTQDPAQHGSDPAPTSPQQSRQRAPSSEKPPLTVTHSLQARRTPSEDSQADAAQSGRSTPSSRRSRNRSTSNGSGRSKSRADKHREDLAKAMTEEDGDGQVSHTGLGDKLSVRIPARSPGAPSMVVQPSPNLPSPATFDSGRSRSTSRAGTPSYFDQHNLKPIDTNGSMSGGLSPRPSPLAPYSVNSTPSLGLSPAGSLATTPTGQGFQTQRIPTNRKKSVNKYDISEPTLISSTSRITTVDLPPGASLQNGAESMAPPLPPINPRRRQTRTQTMFGVFSHHRGQQNESPLASPLLAQFPTEDISTFSADDEEEKPRFGRKLKKSSSEGANMHQRAKQAAIVAPSPAMPSTPKMPDGAMF